MEHSGGPAEDGYPRSMKLGVLLVLFVVAGGGDNLKNSVPGDASIDGVFACGNGIIDGIEECDDGEANGTAGARCDTTCKWVCLEDLKCDDGDPCNGDETCVDHRCMT